MKFLAALAAALLAQSALAQPYPSKPIRVVVNSAPAGFTDVVGRLVTAAMSQSMGQPMIVDC